MSNKTLNTRVAEVPGAVAFSSSVNGVKVIVDFCRNNVPVLDLKMVSSGELCNAREKNAFDHIKLAVSVNCFMKYMYICNILLSYLFSN